MAITAGKRQTWGWEDICAPHVSTCENMPNEAATVMRREKRIIAPTVPVAVTYMSDLAVAGKSWQVHCVRWVWHHFHIAHTPGQRVLGKADLHAQ